MTSVYVPSKGRPNTKTYKLFDGHDFDVIHVVEPQDYDAYRASGVPNLVALPDNDQGIVFVRNFILDHAKKTNKEWVWMIDDDVQGFGYAKDGKTIKGTAAVLSDFHASIERYKFPLNGINYCQYAWAYSTGSVRYKINKKTAEVCTLLYMPKIQWQYRKRYSLKDDRDFCMQAIKYSDGIIVDTHSWFACPGVGSIPGGLQDFYLQKRDQEDAAKMVAEWHPYAKLIHKKSRIDVKLDLAGYAQSLNRVVR